MIFNLFKSKPTLKELIPNGFIDIHSHILPGIDDGAKNIQESKKLISKMKNLGFSKIIFTPHIYPSLYDNSEQSIKEEYGKIKDKINSFGNFSFAAEYLIDNSMIEKAEKNLLLCLKDKYVLCEFSYIGMAVNYHEIIYKLILNGYRPIIAHPERYFYFDKNMEQMFNLKKMGCKFQLNLFSTTGYYGKKVLSLSNFLIKKNFIDFVGTDIHKESDLLKFDSLVKIQDLKGLENAIDNNYLFI